MNSVKSVKLDGSCQEVDNHSLDEFMIKSCLYQTSNVSHTKIERTNKEDHIISSYCLLCNSALNVYNNVRNTIDGIINR